MNPVDIKLKEAMEEIKLILNEYDVAAVVCLSSGEKSEYLNYVFGNEGRGPSWSCLYAEQNGVRLRAKGKRDHAERYKINLTIKCVSTMKELMALQFSAFDRILELAKTKFKIEEGKSFHSAVKLQKKE